MAKNSIASAIVVMVSVLSGQHAYAESNDYHYEFNERCEGKGIESFDRVGTVHDSGYAFIDEDINASRDDYCECAENFAQWSIQGHGYRHGNTAGCTKTRVSGMDVYRADVFIIFD